MSNTVEMSTPVTRGELREELGSLESGLDLKLEDFGSRIEQKIDLWGAVLLAQLTSLERRLLDAIRWHTGAFLEALANQGSGIDAKYRDLPVRVCQLEARVFPPVDET